MLHPRSWIIRHGPNLLTAGLVMGLAWMLAAWTWILLAPSPGAAARAAGPAVDLAASRDRILRSGLFTSGPAASEAEANAPASLNLRLVGVLASNARGEPSLAIVNSGGKGNELIREGREIAPGIVLHRVSRDHVVIRRQGALERINFPDVTTAARPPQEFRLNVQPQGGGQYSFSRGTLTQALQDPAQLAQLGGFTLLPGAGVSVLQAPPGSLAEKLGLQAGDAIRTVNGELVNSPDDLPRLYQKFTSAGKLKLEGARAGAPLELTYTIKP